MTEITSHPDIWETPLNFRVGEIDEIALRLGQFTLDDISGAVRSAGNMGAQYMPPTVYGSGLLRSHKVAGRINGPVEADFYRFGELYGVQLAGDWYEDATGHRLLADNPRAGAAAAYHVRSSYSQDLGERAGISRLNTELARQHYLLGSYKLGILNAMAAPHIKSQLQERYDNAHLPDGHAAFMTGLIDGTAFGYTYGRVREGEVPTNFGIDRPEMDNVPGLDPVHFPHAKGQPLSFHFVSFWHDRERQAWGQPERAAQEIIRMADPLYRPDLRLRVTIGGVACLVDATKYVWQKEWNRFETGYDNQHIRFVDEQAAMPWDVPEVQACIAAARPAVRSYHLPALGYEIAAYEEVRHLDSANPEYEALKGERLARVLLRLDALAGPAMQVEILDDPDGWQWRSYGRY